LWKKASLKEWWDPKTQKREFVDPIVRSAPGKARGFSNSRVFREDF